MQHIHTHGRQAESQPVHLGIGRGQRCTSSTAEGAAMLSPW